MTTEPFGKWFRRNIGLSYYHFMRELDNRQKMRMLLSSNAVRSSAEYKLKSRKNDNSIAKHRGKTRIGRLKGLL